MNDYYLLRDKNKNPILLTEGKMNFDCLTEKMNSKMSNLLTLCSVHNLSSKIDYCATDSQKLIELQNFINNIKYVLRPKTHLMFPLIGSLQLKVLCESFTHDKDAMMDYLIKEGEPNLTLKKSDLQTMMDSMQEFWGCMHDVHENLELFQKKYNLFAKAAALALEQQNKKYKPQEMKPGELWREITFIDRMTYNTTALTTEHYEVLNYLTRHSQDFVQSLNHIGYNENTYIQYVAKKIINYCHAQNFPHESKEIENIFLGSSDTPYYSIVLGSSDRASHTRIYKRLLITSENAIIQLKIFNSSQEQSNPYYEEFIRKINHQLNVVWTKNMLEKSLPHLHTPSTTAGVKI